MALLFFDQLNSSCTNPINGVPIAKDEVIPAKNSKPNQATPDITAITLPHWSNKKGIVLNAIIKPAFSMTQSNPRYPTAIGITTADPSTISTKPFIQPAAIAFNAISSFCFK